MDKIEKDGDKLVVIELGAGTAVPTVRNTSQQIAKRFNVSLIRINPRESFGADVELVVGAIEAVDALF